MAANVGDAGTKDDRVDRPEEGLPGISTVGNAGAAVPTRASFDSAKATGLRRPLPKAVIDTSGTSGLSPDQDIKRGEPASWV